MRASQRFTWAVVLGLVALGANACAPMSVGPPVVTEVPKRVERRTIGNGTTDDAVTQAGSHLTVRVTDRCDVQRVTTVERTTVRERQNDAPQNDWWAGIGGALIAGLGVATAVDPKPIQTDDRDYTKAEVRQGSYALIGVGAALLAVPVIDAIRANREVERKVEVVETPGPTLLRNVACGTPPVSREIKLRYPDGKDVELGRTGAQGRLTVDLAELTPPDVFFARDGSASVFVYEREVGRASLEALYDKRESAAWALAEASPCRTSLDEAACSATGVYVAHYADGEHAPEARKLLDDAAARRFRAREDAAWAQLDLKACRSPAKREMEAIEAACAPLSAHLAEYPNGPHAEEVRAAVRASEPVYARLKEAKERREQARVAVGQWEDDGDDDASVPSTGTFIPYAGNGRGPTLCADGMWSHSSGRGTCSHHGGVAGGSSGSGGSHRSSGGRSSGWGHSSSGGSHRGWGHSSSGGSHRGWGGGGHRSSGGRGRRK